MCAALLPHAQAVLDLTSDGMWQIARYLGYSGSYPAARDLFQLIADAHREDDAYGPEHPDTLAARANLARWTGEAGDAAAARDQFAALLPVRERVSRPRAPGHPDRPRTTSPAGPGRRGMRPGPGTSTPRCCPSASGSSAPSTRTP